MWLKSDKDKILFQKNIIRLKYLKNITLFFLFMCFSCKEEEYRVTPEQLPVEHIFEPVITDMVSSSPLYLPDEIYCKATIINSRQELFDYLPLDIIEDTLQYEDINYSRCSLISMKFRCFYKPYKIEYKVYKKDDEHILIRQMVYTTDSLYINGFYIMSNLIAQKLNADIDISVEQGYSFEEEKLYSSENNNDIELPVSNEIKMSVLF